MVDIFDEVDEELRAERAEQLLKRYAGLIITAAIVVIGAASGWQGWRWYQSQQDMKAATQYIAAISTAEAGAGDAARKAAVAQLEPLIAQAPDGYRTLSRLEGAALMANSGNPQGAAALWNQVAADSGTDPLLRDLASLMWASHEITTGDPSVLAARLRPLAEPQNPWHLMAQEQLALLDLRQGKTDEAKATLRKLSQDVTAPGGLRGRSAALLSRLGG